VLLNKTRINHHILLQAPFFFGNPLERFITEMGNLWYNVKPLPFYAKGLRLNSSSSWCESHLLQTSEVINYERQRMFQSHIRQWEHCSTITHISDYHAGTITQSREVINLMWYIHFSFYCEYHDEFSKNDIRIQNSCINVTSIIS